MRYLIFCVQIEQKHELKKIWMEWKRFGCEYSFIPTHTSLCNIIFDFVSTIALIKKIQNQLTSCWDDEFNEERSVQLERIISNCKFFISSAKTLLIAAFDSNSSSYFVSIFFCCRAFLQWKHTHCPFLQTLRPFMSLYHVIKLDGFHSYLEPLIFFAMYFMYDLFLRIVMDACWYRVKSSCIICRLFVVLRL